MGAGGREVGRKREDLGPWRSRDRACSGGEAASGAGPAWGGAGKWAMGGGALAPDPPSWVPHRQAEGPRCAGV